MSKHNIELPPLPLTSFHARRPYETEFTPNYSVGHMRQYARAAIKPYQRRIEELESQLEAIGAGGVSSHRITSPSRGEAVAFAKDGNLFWRGDPVAWREFSGELYLAPQPANPSGASTLHNAGSGVQNGIQATQPVEPVKVPQPHEFNTGNEKLDALLDDTFYLAKDGGMGNAIKWQESLEEFLASIEPVKVPPCET